MAPRTKELAKKRRHDGASSSRQHEDNEPEEDTLVAGTRKLRLNALGLARVTELRTKTVLGGYYFDFPLLDTFGCREKVEELTSLPYWEQVFRWRGATYEPLIYEFVATLEITDEKSNAKPSIAFTLFGRPYHISVNDLGIYLGFYTQEDIYTHWYANLPEDFPDNRWLEDYWKNITNRPEERFTGARPNTKLITSNALKVVKLLLNLTFGGRVRNLHKVYRWDLFLLRSMDHGINVNMGVVCKKWLQSQTGESCPYIFVGPILAQLCEGLNLGDKMLREKRTASMAPLSMAELNRGYLVRVEDTEFPEDVPRLPPPAGQEWQEMPSEGNVPPHYGEVNDWASMRAFQYQLHTEMMTTFGRRMDHQDEMLARHGEQIEELRQMMEDRFPPPSQGGGSSY